jgi:hypothetical protein
MTRQSQQFELLATRAMSRNFGMPLQKGRVSGVPKEFDLVSADRSIVGEAKYFTMVGGERLPPAKFSVIAEHVWLLQHASAARRFLVFGNDARVPQEWLKRYGNLAQGVESCFLAWDGEVRILRS